MNHYKLALEIELDAENPLEAAKAFRDMVIEDGGNMIYNVQDDQTGEIVSVDLDEPDEDTVLPTSNDEYEPLIMVYKHRATPFVTERQRMIDRIKNVIDKWGGVTTMELELDHDPCITSIGNGKNNVSQLIGAFNANGTVTATTYQDELELGDEDIDFEDLTDDILAEIEEIMERFDQTETENN